MSGIARRAPAARVVGQATDLEQPHHAVAVRAHRFEQLDHLGVVDRAAQQTSSRSSWRGGSRRPTARRRRRTPAAPSRPRSTPRRRAATSAPRVPRAARPVTSRSSDSARCAQPTMVRARPGSTLARWNSHDGMRRHTSAERRHPHPRGAGPGAGVPNLVTSSRQARNASMPCTRCSRPRGSAPPAPGSVRPSRRCGTRRCAAATSARPGRNRTASSSAPSIAGSASTNSSAPLPHACAVDRVGRRPVMRAVTGPLRIRLVRQIGTVGAVAENTGHRDRGAAATASAPGWPARRRYDADRAGHHHQAMRLLISALSGRTRRDRRSRPPRGTALVGPDRVVDGLATLGHDW